MVEYGLMVSLIAVASLLVIVALGDSVFDTFDQTNTAVRTNDGVPKTPTTPATP